MLSKLKNIAKRWEGCSKSHFSHIRNKVEKVTLRPLILERFLGAKSTQDREKVVSKSLQKSSRFSIRFFIDLGSILDPMGHPKIEYFSVNFALGVALGPRGCSKCSRTAPEVNFHRILYHFRVDFGRFFNDFRTYFNTISRLISHSMLPFLQH